MLRRLALLTLLAAVVPAVALADPGAYDIWQGKAGKLASVSIVRQVGHSDTTASISFQCTAADGTINNYTSDLTGKSHGRKLTLSGAALNGAGTAKLHAKLKRKRAKGHFSVDITFADDNATTCKVAHTFSIKGRRATGG